MIANEATIHQSSNEVDTVIFFKIHPCCRKALRFVNPLVKEILYLSVRFPVCLCETTF